MVAVDEYAHIRLAHRDGVSVRELARRFHHSRKKIREILVPPEPKTYQRLNPPPSILEPFKPTIDAILAADEQAPPKQRHTAARLFRRLRQEFGYGGGYDRVRRYLGSRAQQHREVFLPLDHDAGQRLEADFGHIGVDFPEGRRQVPVLVVTWAWSNCPFALALPTERTEAILHSMVEAFAFYGCVPPGTAGAFLHRGDLLSPASTNKDLRHLKAALSIAAEWGYLVKLPQVRMEKAPRKLPTYVTCDHFAAIYKTCDIAKMPGGNILPADWWQALLVMGYMTGWRIGDMLALRRDQLARARRAQKRGELRDFIAIDDRDGGGGHRLKCLHEPLAVRSAELH